MEEERPEWVEQKSPEHEVDENDQEAIDAFNALPSGSRCISLYRHPTSERGGRPMFISQILPESFNEPFVQELYGGGRYQGKYRTKDGKLLVRYLDIFGAPKDHIEEKPSKEEKLQDQRREEEAYEPYYREHDAGQDRGLSTLDVMKLMQETRREARDEMRSLLEMMRPAQQNPDATQQVFSLVEKIAPLMAQSGGGDGGNPWLMALMQFKDPILKIVESVATVATRPPSFPPSGPPPQHNPIRQPSPSQGVQEVQEPDMIGLLLRQALPVLVNAAKKNVETGTYADMILDQVPESQYPRFKAWLERPDCLEEIAKFDPGIRYQQEWWTSLRDNLLEALTPDAAAHIQSHAGLTEFSEAE